MAAAPSDEVQVESATRRPSGSSPSTTSAFFRSAARAIVDSTPGFELVGESADGESALELIPRLDPDIVILDVRMPGIDGIDVADRLHREDPDRIIILASSARAGALSRLARGCGAQRCRAEALADAAAAARPVGGAPARRPPAAGRDGRSMTRG